MTAADYRARADEAQADAAALRDDLPKLEQLLAKKDEAFREARAQSVPSDKLVDLRAKRDAVMSMIGQQEADILSAEADARERDRLACIAEADEAIGQAASEFLRLHREHEADTPAVLASFRRSLGKWFRRGERLNQLKNDLERVARARLALRNAPVPSGGYYGAHQVYSEVRDVLGDGVLTAHLAQDFTDAYRRDFSERARFTVQAAYQDATGRSA